MKFDYNRVGSWIFYNQPVQQKVLAAFLGDKDPKMRTALTDLTENLPLYEEDNGSLGINRALRGFMDFEILALKDL